MSWKAGMKVVHRAQRAWGVGVVVQVADEGRRLWIPRGYQAPSARVPARANGCQRARCPRPVALSLSKGAQATVPAKLSVQPLTMVDASRCAR